MQINSQQNYGKQQIGFTARYEIYGSAKKVKEAYKKIEQNNTAKELSTEFLTVRVPAAIKRLFENPERRIVLTDKDAAEFKQLRQANQKAEAFYNSKANPDNQNRQMPISEKEVNLEKFEFNKFFNQYMKMGAEKWNQFLGNIENVKTKTEATEVLAGIKQGTFDTVTGGSKISLKK